MANVYTLTLSSGSGAITSVDTIYVKRLNHEFLTEYVEDIYSNVNPPTHDNEITKITPPTWASGVKTFGGYKDSDGDFRIDSTGLIINRYWKSGGSSPSSYGKPVNANDTLTAVWTSVCPTATISKNSGTGGTDEIYYNANDGKWYLDYPFTTELSASHPITIPTRAQYQFLGCYSANNTTSTKYINADGTPTADFLALTPTDDITIYAQWQQVSYKVTVPHSGGTPTSTVFYAKIGETGMGRFYADDLCTTPISSITPPKKELYVWNGSFSSNTQSAANTYINASGEFQSLLYGLTITADKSLGSYSNYWTATNAAKITLSGSGWTFAQAAYYTDKTNGGVYAEWVRMDAPLSSLPIPSRDGYRFLGFYSTNATTGTNYVNYSGVIQDALNNRKAATTAYCVGRAKSRTVTLDDDGGSGGIGKFYLDATDQCAFNAVSATIASVTIPTKSGYVFKGYWNGSDCIVNENGAITYIALTANKTFTARWEIIRYFTVTFNANGGTAEQNSRQVQEGHTVGELPAATKTGYSSLGWFTQQEGGDPVDASTVITEDVTFSVHWQAVQYAITYMMNGGTNAPTNPDFYTIEQYVSLAEPTRTGFAFDGWLPMNYIPSGSTGAKSFTATWKTAVYISKPTAVSGATYNGSAQTGVTFDGSLTYTGTVSATNAGNYSATFSLPVDTSETAYRWSDGTTASVTVNWSIAARSVADSSVTFATIPNQGYTGSAIRPDVTMYYGGATRTLGTDFTVVYSNNVNVGTATATVSGIGNFGGTKSLTFQIVTPEPGNVYIAKPTAALDVTYTGSAQSGVSYDNRLTVSGTVSATNAGTYTATFTLPSNTSSAIYKWEDSSTAAVSVSWTIAPRSVSNVNVTFAPIPNQAYTGTYVTPNISMSYAGVARTLGTDYVVVYSNNVNVGTATATVRGIGNFAGTRNLSFAIVRGTVVISKPTAISGLVFNGQSQTGVDYDNRLTVSGTAASISAGSHSATFSLPNQTSTSTYEWSDGTTSAVVVQWSMLPLAITDSSVVFDGIPAQNYTGYPITPSVSARIGSYELTLGVDFNTSYSDNTNVGTATVTVSGITNLTGTKSLSFLIVPPASRVVTFDGCGGTPSESSYTLTDGSQVGTLPTATRTGYVFIGWFTEETGGEEVLPTRIINANVTFYAHWQIVSYEIDYLLGGGSNNPNNPLSYTIEDAVTLESPVRDGYSFVGWIPDGGVIAAGSTGPKTFSALWTSSTSYTVTFDANGGSSSDTTRTVIENEQIGTLPTATRLGHRFDGWYTAKTGGVQISASYVVTADVVIYARWTANTYTLTFNGNGATPSFASKTVTFGQAVGNLPTVYRYGHTFGYWSVGGNQITSSTIWGYSESMTATALWDISFGNVIDYFSLGSAKLIPESSDSGDNRQRVAVRHYGKTESGVNATSGVWRNPTVTYAVVGSGNVSVTLGKAFAGSATVSGYMITSAVITTKIGEFPKLTVTATANEGVDAINKFPVTVSVLARARAQNLMSAVSGGGELQELTLAASCDPVVVAENMMPCASDVVNGRITVSATTGAFSNQAEPTAGNGFAQVGAPIACGGTAYKQWRVNLIKEI